MCKHLKTQQSGLTTAIDAEFTGMLLNWRQKKFRRDYRWVKKNYSRHIASCRDVSITGCKGEVLSRLLPGAAGCRKPDVAFWN